MPKLKVGGGSSPSPSIARSPSPPPSSSSAQKRKADDIGDSSPAKKPKTDEAKDNSTEARLKRKHQRDLDRMSSSSAVASHSGTSGFRADAGGLAKKTPKNEPKTKLDTPFGPVNASKFPTSDPGFKITTEAKNYGKKSSVGHKYSDLVDGMRKSGATDKEIATDLLKALEGKDPEKLTSGQAKNAAAKLSAITHVSEPQRVLGSDKAARGVLRMVQSGEISLDQAFKGETPTYPMAKNPDYMRRTVNYKDQNFKKETPKPTEFDKLGGYMSDSSGDES
ncbi:hypothetical protein JY651_15885 [Pyxidicoccus parkwayensis]|uniref:Uncharacterized protein n=1 Tax=Pyxidicoccus parkwayensis TaxID=2813578 RepID=A0ABX7P725_9BACT|nr:hypothetical protein [Pyxidicoccus parkwaysis]QSQ26319.1 hypothetical protein JY651_15885 [Pyxidicoccus parkwaysis]